MHRHRSTPHGQEQHDVTVSKDGTSHVGRSHGRKRALCICIDDFGMHQGVDQASLQLIDMNRVHAVGCLVGGASWRAGHGALRRLDASSVDVGLHLDFTEFPLTLPAPHKLGALIAGSWLGQLDARAVRTEIRAQFDGFEQTMGRAPAFVDGHQHVHQLPVIRQELLRELQERHPDRRPWLRSTKTSAPWLSTPKPRIIEALGAGRFVSMTRQAGFRHNHRLLGVYDFQGGQPRYWRLLQQWLRIAANADLLMTHPSLDLGDADGLMAARLAEFQVLSGKPFADLLDAEGIVLLPMSRLL